jgi:hypothetical protein
LFFAIVNLAVLRWWAAPASAHPAHPEMAVEGAVVTANNGPEPPAPRHNLPSGAAVRPLGERSTKWIQLIKTAPGIRLFGSSASGSGRWG